MESINWSFFRREFIKQGGEKLSQVFSRMDSCIREKAALHPGKHIVFLSHGDPVMAIKIKYLGMALRSRKEMYPICGSCRRVYNTDGWIRKNIICCKLS